MRRDYRDPTYKKFRQKVLARDKHKCQWYGCNSSKKLNVHHIHRWCDNPGLRYDENNGITLCSLHHKMISGQETYYESIFKKIAINNKLNNDK